jgi:hypothetical protein
LVYDHNILGHFTANPKEPKITDVRTRVARMGGSRFCRCDPSK